MDALRPHALTVWREASGFTVPQQAARTSAEAPILT
jgi:hypothetical protein